MNFENAVTAVFVTYNSADVIVQAIEAMRQAGVSKIIVVDNASVDHTCALVESLNVHLIRNVRNIGFGPASNVGFAAVKTPFAMLTNPDCMVLPSTISTLYNAAENLPETIIFAPILQKENGAPFIRGQSILAPFLKAPYRKKILPDGVASYPVVSGAAILVRMEAFEGQPVFDPEIFLYHEDDDLCARVWSMGSSCVLVPEARAIHEGNISSPVTAHLQYWKGWHMAWSESYVRRKYQLGSIRFSRRFKMWSHSVAGHILCSNLEHAYARGFQSGLQAFKSGQSACETGIPAS